MAQSVGYSPSDLDHADEQYLWFPCGVIRGALANMGINTTVQAETSELPTATFQIKSVQPRP